MDTCFQLLAVANMCYEHGRTMSAYSESLLLIPLGIYPEVELLGYMNAWMFQALFTCFTFHNERKMRGVRWEKGDNKYKQVLNILYLREAKK